MSPQVQIKPWLHCRPLSAVFCCLYSALGPPLAGARCHRSHFGSRYRSGLRFPAGLFLSIAAASCCLAPCSAHLLLELDVTAGTDQALAPLPASFCCFCCLYSALGPPLAGARYHRSHFGSRYRSGLRFPAGLFLSIAAASCCLAPCSAHLLLELDVTAGTDQALAPLPASFCCFLLSLQRTGPTSCWS